ncbi:MAG: PilN domain-containing protein [Acidobacteria bacterium]|nr:PilN domain-containing protein [Acidobacteriota bacterium]
MIKINLLSSVTDRDHTAAVVEERVTNPRARSWVLLTAVFALMSLIMVFDYVSANSAHASAQTELDKQKQIAAQMAAINKEQAELQKKINDTQTRIDAIKRLRAAQQGPVAVLSEINQRLPSVADFRLESIEQKSGDLTITGHSPNEAAVTQFGRSLEFSSGLFLNVNLETERAVVEINPMDYDQTQGPIDTTGKKPETVKFKVKCKYAPLAPPAPAPAAQPQQQSQAANAAPNQVAQK